MSELRVHMDPLNPGQFFACCGLLELNDLDAPGALAFFDLSPSQPRVAEFVVQPAPDLSKTLARLRSAKPGFPDEAIEKSIRPCVIPYGGREIVLDWWLDEFRRDKSDLKCWAGQVTTRKLFSDLLSLLEDDTSGADVFECVRMTKSKFGVDPRSAWNALDLGFSPNEHDADAETFPAVEILAAIGLQGFRPDARNRSPVSYSPWRDPLPGTVARIAFRAPWAGLAHTRYAFSIEARGQSYKYFTFGKESTNP